MKTKYYLINNNYQAIIKTSKDNDRICIGGLNKICFTIFIEKKTNNAYIQEIQHDKHCILKNILKHGHDNVIFLQTCILFIFKLYANVNILELTDNSFIYCKGGKISLPDFYIIKHGFTWYESYLDATIKKKSNDIFIQLKEFVLNKTKEIITLSKESFINLYFNHLDSNNQKIIKDLYQPHMTNGELLKCFFDSNIKCQYYFIFFNKTIGNKLQGLDWIITRESITKYSIDINYKQLKKQIEHDNINNIIKKSNTKIEKSNDLIIDFKEISKYENMKI